MGLRRLSKSQYVKGRNCLRRIWLYNFRRDQMEPPSDFQAGIFEQGHLVGKLAHSLFPGGVLVEQDHTDPDGALAKTAELLASDCPAIFEAAFIHDNILVRADIVAKNRDGSWDLYEVKSSTSLKKEHLHDAAIQKFVLLGAGFRLRKTNVVHLNSDYVRDGEIDIRQLFTIEFVDEKIIEAFAEIPAYLATIRGSLAQDAEPAHPIGSVCKNPYPCEFKAYCWLGVEPDTIHFISRISDARRAELLSRAIEKIKDVPDDIALSELQFVQVKVERDGHPHVDRAKIKKFLGELKHPLWFLDFETYGFAIPEYDGTWSYQALPFQFSLHVQEREGGDIRHVEFLHMEKSDPRRALAEAMIAAIGDQGNVVVYYAPFEKTRIKEMIEAFPDLRVKLESILDRIWDLETPFSKKWYYDRRFEGRSSIKNVLPVLVPDMSYKGLAIGKGDVAQAKYVEMIQLPAGSPERETIRKNLLEYCGQDSLAMVKVLDALLAL